MKFRNVWVSMAFFMPFALNLSAQDRCNCVEVNGQSVCAEDGVTPCVNTIVTAMPFLRIMPDARYSAMGDMGVALSPDANSMANNQSNLVFNKSKFGAAVTYNSWLRSLGVNDVYLAYASGFAKIDKNQAIGFDLRFFSLGNIDYRDAQGNSLGSGKPNEFSIGASYSRRLGKNWSAAVGMHYLYSRLADGNYNGVVVQPGSGVSADLSVTYDKPMKIGANTAKLRVATAITNVGTKISYTQSLTKDYIPANMALGTSFQYDFDDHNSLTFGIDLNKLLVPTPQYKFLYQNGTTVTNTSFDSDNNNIPDYKEYSVIESVFKSFGDAPGGFAEEMKEINISTGIEYWYNKQFAVRAGYYNEDAMKGARKFVTAGIGVKYNVFNLNVSYILPTTNSRSPLDNTLRFSLLFEFGDEDAATEAPTVEPPTTN